MRCPCFRGLGIFVGSGAFVAGCRAVVAQRMTPSGMRWTVGRAKAIFVLLAQASSGPTRWEEAQQWPPCQIPAA